MGSLKLRSARVPLLLAALLVGSCGSEVEVKTLDFTLSCGGIGCDSCDPQFTILPVSGGIRLRAIDNGSGNDLVPAACLEVDGPLVLEQLALGLDNIMLDGIPGDVAMTFEAMVSANTVGQCPIEDGATVIAGSDTITLSESQGPIAMLVICQ